MEHWNFELTLAGAHWISITMAGERQQQKRITAHLVIGEQYLYGRVSPTGRGDLFAGMFEMRL